MRRTDAKLTKFYQMLEGEKISHLLEHCRSTLPLKTRRERMGVEPTPARNATRHRF